jgi:CHAD domain-containing protein
MKRKSTPNWDASADTAAAAREHLPALAARYFAAGRKTFARKADPETLHAFRIETKRFRYTLELFQPLYGPGLAERLELLRKVQQYLGDINDCVITERLLRSTSADGGPPKKLLRALAARSRQRRRKLIEFWRQNFDAPGAEQSWVRYLRAWAGRTGRRATPRAEVARSATPAEK